MGEKGPQEDRGVRTPNAIDTAVPLHQPHRVPREVVVHHVAALLEIHALGEDVRAEQQVKAILRVRRKRARRDGREAVKRPFP